MAFTYNTRKITMSTYMDSCFPAFEEATLRLQWHAESERWNLFAAIHLCQFWELSDSMVDGE